jgi:putative ABC transport system permease protein
MLRHLMKLIWKRKGRNLMLSLEILLAFIIVFAIAAFGLRSYQLYQLPIGFDHADVWSVNMSTAADKKALRGKDAYEQFRLGLKGLPEVREVAFASGPPYMRIMSRTDFDAPGGGKHVRTEVIEVSDDYFAVLKIKPELGRAFDRRDDGAAAVPVVINRRLAREMWGQESALGKQFDTAERGSKTPVMMTVVGVVDELRKRGELDTPGNVMITRNVPASDEGMRAILIRMAPGTPRAFEETLNRQLKLINNAITYEISPVAALRTSMLSSELMPLKILSVIAAFLLLMVAFGLFGVLWQNTTRRIPEIGLRRAIGANAGNIYRQIIAEQFLLSSGAMLVALLLLVQLPLTGALGESLNWSVFLSATAVSMGVIYLLSLLCSVYPGWRASRLSPTEALHYE